MGQGALSKPDVQWWLSLNSSRLSHATSQPGRSYRRKGPLGIWLSSTRRSHTRVFCKANSRGPEMKNPDRRCVVRPGQSAGARVCTRLEGTESPTGPVCCAPGSLALRRLVRVIHHHKRAVKLKPKPPAGGVFWLSTAPQRPARASCSIEKGRSPLQATAHDILGRCPTFDSRTKSPPAKHCGAQSYIGLSSRCAD